MPGKSDVKAEVFVSCVLVVLACWPFRWEGGTPVLGVRVLRYVFLPLLQ